MLSCRFFLFLMQFEGNFILNQFNKQQLYSFFSLFLSFLLSPLSSFSPFYCAFDDSQAFVELLLWSASDGFSKRVLFLNRGTEQRIRFDAPLSPHLKAVTDICDSFFFFFFMLLLLLFGSYWVCALRFSYSTAIRLSLSFVDAFSHVFVLSSFNLLLLAPHWKFTGFFSPFPITCKGM